MKVSTTNAAGTSGAAGALTTIIVWMLTLNGVDVPGEVQGALTVLIMTAAVFLTPLFESKPKGDHEA